MTEAVVRGDIDPSVTPEVMANPSNPTGQAIDAELQRLVSAGTLLRIKVWTQNGTVAFSDLPALRGRQFPVDDDLTEVFEGNVSTSFSSGTDAENVFERGLADEFLSIYLPIRSTAAGGQVIGAYEVYEDAAPIMADVMDSRRDVLLIVGGMALGLLALLFAAFSVASRRLTNQSRRVLEHSMKELALTADLRRSQERFRSLVQNSADVNMILRSGRDDRVRKPGRRTRPRFQGRGSHRSQRAGDTASGRPRLGRNAPRRCRPIPRLDDHRRIPDQARRRVVALDRGRRQEPVRRSGGRRRGRQLSRHHLAQDARGGTPAPGLPRLADGPRQPRPVRRPAGARPVPCVARAARAWPSCSSISTISRRSTTASGTARAMRSSSASGNACVVPCGRAIPSRGWAATNSRCSSRTRPWPPSRRPSPSG